MLLYYPAQTAIENSTHQKGFNIYPNPFSDQLTVENTLPYNRLTIRDLAGKSVYDSRLQKESIDLSFLPSGVYRASIFSIDKLVFTSPLVKIK